MLPKIKDSKNDDDVLFFHANQIALQIADFVSEIHDTHHAITSTLTYEEQKEESMKRAKYFTSLRLEKYLLFLERVLRENKSSDSKYLIGETLSYVDLVLFGALTGVQHSFPKNMKRLEEKIPLIYALQKRVSEVPTVKEYMASKRRLPYGHGIFRHYPELDYDN